VPVTATAFAKRSPVAIDFDKKLGRAVGWACFSKKGGEPYVDLHGDHFPDDELFKAVDGLMKLPLADRQINVDHAGGARGTIVTAYALTEDVAKSLGADTGGDYGIVVTFEPDGELMKAIEAGTVCLSIEGKAHDVETVAKAADIYDAVNNTVVVRASAHKRTMRRVELTKLAVVAAGAHEGASVTLIKSAPPSEAVHRLRKLAAAIAKRTPGMTTPVDGHQHLIFDTEEADGFTSYETGPGATCGHSHPFVREPDGSITIGAANGHSHTLATPSTEPDTMPDPALAKAESDLTAAKESIGKLHAELDALEGLLGVAASMTEDEKEVAKGLKGPALREFLAQPADVRKSRATPIYKGADGATYYPGDERAANLAKRVDTAEAATRDAEFAKRAAAEIPALPGTIETHVAVLKAVHGIPGAAELLKGANAAMATLMKAPGVGGGNVEPGSPLEALEKAAAAFAKSVGKPVDKVYDDFLATDEGKALYATYKAAHPSSRA
jgi:hypothetical protein